MTATIIDMHRDTHKNNADARALDPMLTVKRERAADWATVRLWGSTNGVPLVGNRRMVARGRTHEDSDGAFLSVVGLAPGTGNRTGYIVGPWQD